MNPLVARLQHDSDPSGWLSVATVPTDCTGMRWPCRLLEVEPVGGHPAGEGIPMSDTHLDLVRAAADDAEAAAHALRLAILHPLDGVPNPAVLELARESLHDALDRLD